jgi:hypothetical protein
VRKMGTYGISKATYPFLEINIRYFHIFILHFPFLDLLHIILWKLTKWKKFMESIIAKKEMRMDSRKEFIAFPMIKNRLKTLALSM